MFHLNLIICKKKTVFPNKVPFTGTADQDSNTFFGRGHHSTHSRTNYPAMDRYYPSALSSNSLRISYFTKITISKEEGYFMPLS